MERECADLQRLVDRGQWPVGGTAPPLTSVTISNRVPRIQPMLGRVVPSAPPRD